jgi:hypothetical protein
MTIKLLPSIIAGSLFLAMSTSLAQTPAQPGEAQSSRTGCQQKQISPGEARGQAQPQGETGPTSTASGGAPPANPQGDTPPGMQHKSGVAEKSTGNSDGC